MMRKAPSVSIVIPCHNEEEVINDTVTYLDGLLSDLKTKKLIREFEFNLVNNGSTDNTLDRMLELKKKLGKKIKIIDLRRNFGYQGSITAGLNYVTKEVAITIDADLQDDPLKIEEMVGKFREGFDLVLGVREDRQNDSYFKKKSAELFYKFLNFIKIDSVYNHGEFRLLSKGLVDEFVQLPEVNRYIRSLILQLESKYACVYYKRTERKKGETKFSIPKLFALAIDGITSFSNFPIRLVTFSGMAMFILSFFGILYVIYIKLFTAKNVSGWASLAVFFLFFAGLQSFFLGIVGEYIAKMYLEIKKRPIFIVRKIY